MTLWCAPCNIVDTNDNVACRECYEALTTFTPIGPRFSVGTGAVPFTPAIPVYTAEPSYVPAINMRVRQAS